MTATDEMISGFMMVRDVASQGYPFIEAATAALAACDELVISDGYSRDRTWEGLIAVRDVFGDRVRLYQDRWPGGANRGSTLATVTNVARRRCAGQYCLMVQANEVVHEHSAQPLRELPIAYPGLDIFELRYLLLMGPLVAANTLRRRLFRNRPDIVAVGDAYDVDSVEPGRPVTTAPVPLPEPVYRYRAISPTGYVAKLRAIRPRTRLWATELELAERALGAAAGAADPAACFWMAVRDYLAEDSWLRASEGTSWPRGALRSIERAPAAVRPLLGRWRFDLDDSLAWLAAQGARA
jgi:hypothetical protein